MLPKQILSLSEGIKQAMRSQATCMYSELKTPEHRDTA
ncbi:hypothetical protein B6N60_04972 [Richelia sinica FACHB-800]|uniref:Uncharacterized protein n=1 Tax=Richelia sinica FACHB-800 TaxID=1357546 RepID=A0A975TCE8_9NOST|nr:hypothetical protein B6N60_04972 [Richelia sinica FACHB-800]